MSSTKCAKKKILTNSFVWVDNRIYSNYNKTKHRFIGKIGEILMRGEQDDKPL